MSCRIDLIGCPTVWAPFTSFCDILPCTFADFCGLRFSISVPVVVSPGPGLWKFNISILEEDGYCQLIREFGLVGSIADPVSQLSWTGGSWGSLKSRESPCTCFL